MFLLRGSVSALMSQVAARDLVPHLREQFWHVFGEYPSAAEVRSWERSIPALLRQLADAGLHDVEVLVEYRLPLTSKRADIVLLGRHPRGGPSCVVVENKQWSRVVLADTEYRLVAASGAGGAGAAAPAGAGAPVCGVPGGLQPVPGRASWRGGRVRVLA